MTPERWRELTTIFHAAREREEAERAAYLDRACGGDASLRAEIESLLAAQGTLGAGPGTEPQLSAGTMFGLYRVDELIGAGGMGQVYRATDTRLQRTVALKLLLPELTRDPAFSARFEREARLRVAQSSERRGHLRVRTGGTRCSRSSSNTWTARRSSKGIAGARPKTSGSNRRC
jgi:hypothetical protein